MSIDENKVENEIVEDVAEEQLQEDSEELVENEEVLDEETEELEEGSHKDEEEEEHDDEEEEHESKVKEIAVPKTKAGVIQAAVEMLKKARKEDAQKLFAKMTKWTKLQKKNQSHQLMLL